MKVLDNKRDHQGGRGQILIAANALERLKEGEHASHQLKLSRGLRSFLPAKKLIAYSPDRSCPT